MAPGPIPDELGSKTAAGASAVGVGVAEATTGAVSKGFGAAAGALTRVREMLRIQNVTQAMDGIGEALRNVAGQSSATLAPHLTETVHHLPEVAL